MSKSLVALIFAVCLVVPTLVHGRGSVGALQPGDTTVVPSEPEALDVDPHPWWVIDRAIVLADGSRVNVVSASSGALNGARSDPSVTPGEKCGPNNSGVCTAQAQWCHGLGKPNAVPNICRAGASCCLATLWAAPRFAEVEAEAESEAALPTPGQACGRGGVCSGQAKWCGGGAAAGKPVATRGLCAGTAVCCLPRNAPAAPTPAPRPAPVPAPARPVTPAPVRPVTPAARPASAAWWGTATRVAGLSGPAFSSNGVYKIVLHTTEGSTAAAAVGAYRTHKSWPHFTVSWENNRFVAKQHIPITHSARALLHPRNTCHTNNLHAIQIEITGFCANAPQFAQGYLDGIGSLLRWIQSQTNVKAIAPPASQWIPHPRSYGSKAAQRMTCQTWAAFNGVCGHQHVPNNKHGDPGVINIAYLLSKMAP